MSLCLHTVGRARRSATPAILSMLVVASVAALPVHAARAQSVLGSLGAAAKHRVAAAMPHDSTVRDSVAHDSTAHRSVAPSPTGRLGALARGAVSSAVGVKSAADLATNLKTAVKDRSVGGVATTLMQATASTPQSQIAALAMKMTAQSLADARKADAASPYTSPGMALQGGMGALYQQAATPDVAASATLTPDQREVVAMLQRAQTGDTVAARQFMRFQMEMNATAMAASAGGPPPDEAAVTHQALVCARTGQSCRAPAVF